MFPQIDFEMMLRAMRGSGRLLYQAVSRQQIAVPICRLNSKRFLASFSDLNIQTFAAPSSTIDPRRLQADSQWPAQYVRKLVFKIHPDLFQNTKHSDVSPANSEALSRLNNIVDFLNTVSEGTAVTIPAGSVPPAQTLTFYLKGDTDQLQKVDIRFEVPASAPDKLVQMSRGYCNTFLLSLLKRMQVPLPPATEKWVEYHGKLDCHRASTSPLVLPDQQVGTSNVGADSAGDEDTEAATLGAVFGQVFPSRPATPQNNSTSASKSSFSSAQYRRANDFDRASTQLQRSLKAHQELAHDILFTTEISRNEKGGVERLVRRMLSSKLIFFGRELSAKEERFALHNFCALLRVHWYQLDVRSWFGLPFMFAHEYSSKRAPGFIVIPYKFRSDEVIEFIVARAAQIKREEPVEAASFSDEGEFERAHGAPLPENETPATSESNSQSQPHQYSAHQPPTTASSPSASVPSGLGSSIPRSRFDLKEALKATKIHRGPLSDSVRARLQTVVDRESDGVRNALSADVQSTDWASFMNKSERPESGKSATARPKTLKKYATAETNFKF